MRKRFKLILIFGSCLLLFSALSVKAETMLFDGQKRSYKMFNPATAGKKPLVLLLHGGTLNAAKAWRASLFPALAQQEGFILIAPDAIDGHWNDGRDSAFWTGKPINLYDDVGFLSALIDKAVQEYDADPSRVYISGASNGGNMAYRMACERPDKITAIAPAIASLQEKIARNCAINKSMPVILFVGTEDPLTPFEGGTSAKALREAGKPDFEPRLSMRDTIAFWAKNNGCQLEPDGTKLPDIHPKDHSHVVEYIFKDCKKGGNTAYYEVIGGGHHIPSLKPYRFFNDLLGKKLGYHNHDIDAEKLSWEFFKRIHQ